MESKEEEKEIQILVVDEDENMRAFFSKIGNDLGYRMTESTSVERALEFIDSGACHLIISDIRFEKMDGLAILEHVKNKAPHIEVIIATVPDSLESAISAIRAGAYDFIMKPVEDFRLVIKVLDRAAEKVRLVMDNMALSEMLKSSSEKLEDTAKLLDEAELRDSLTGLYNHRHFQEVLAKETARSFRYSEFFSLLLIDIDKFGEFNNFYGHATGDEVLRVMSDMLSEGKRACDIIARYGGQEFVILLPETPKEGARHLAERYRNRIAEYAFPAASQLQAGEITVSIGVSTFPEDGDSKETLIEEVAQLVQEAKRQGRNRTCVAGEEPRMKEGS
ncbi:MAG: diguanylate cyclase [Deltaproteobacteria bacterium]|nr:diguanylate cyclase [Deltaproteobacteria bacterium]